MCAFFWPNPILEIWVCTSTRTTSACFFRASSCSAMPPLEPSPYVRLVYFVNAFFLDLYLHRFLGR